VVLSDQAREGRLVAIRCEADHGRDRCCVSNG
jgi:hypothetical protein